MAVDLSKYLPYIRYQGGEGCWGYATCAVWDIMNELYCPNSPAISMNLWLMLHRNKDFWKIDGDKRIWDFYTPDGRHYIFKDGPEYGFFQSFGMTTEGTEPHVGSTRWTGFFTEEGMNEAQNYRLKSLPVSIDISSKSFCKELDKWLPIRLEANPPKPIAGHLVAIVGYDEVRQTFKYVDSKGDREGQGGFKTFTFAEIDNKMVWGNYQIEKALTFEIVTPRPVPVANIWIKHDYSRMNLNLWLSVEGSPQPKKKIWPAYELADYSQTLHYNVRLPAEFIWPPSSGNRIILDLYDSGAQWGGGGEIVELRASFGNHTINSEQVLNQWPIRFKSGEHKQFTIP
jgi:hypothetical protein